MGQSMRPQRGRHAFSDPTTITIKTSGRWDSPGTSGQESTFQCRDSWLGSHDPCMRSGQLSLNATASFLRPGPMHHNTEPERHNKDPTAVQSLSHVFHVISSCSSAFSVLHYSCVCSNSMCIELMMPSKPDSLLLPSPFPALKPDTNK